MDQNNTNPTQPIPSAPEAPVQQPPAAPIQPQQPIMPTPQAATMPPAAQPVTPQTPPSSLTSSPSSHSKLLIIGILVLIIVLGGLSYLLFMNSNSTSQTQSTAQVPTVMPTATIIPTATPTPDLETQAESIDTGNPETDLTEINADVSGL